ncbi:MAG: hypothetical protein ABW123_10020, partial [Cystobacter sp.]
MADTKRDPQTLEAEASVPAAPGLLPSAQPPVLAEPLRVGAPASAAGGVTAVVKAMQHAWTEMGAVRGAKTLLQVNQAHGFDCPGC